MKLWENYEYCFWVKFNWKEWIVSSEYNRKCKFLQRCNEMVKTAKGEISEVAFGNSLPESAYERR